MPRRLLLPALLVALAGCGSGGDAPPGPVATVEFAYYAPTTVDPTVAQQFSACVQAVGNTHLHPSWQGFARNDMTPVDPDVFVITFTDVPVGVLQTFRINDGNVCDTDPTGATRDDIFANGVLLTQAVLTPGSGQEPGLAFTVAADGTVTP